MNTMLSDIEKVLVVIVGWMTCSTCGVPVYTTSPPLLPEVSRGECPLVWTFALWAGTLEVVNRAAEVVAQGVSL